MLQQAVADHLNQTRPHSAVGRYLHPLRYLDAITESGWKALCGQATCLLEELIKLANNRRRFGQPLLLQDSDLQGRCFNRSVRTLRRYRTTLIDAGLISVSQPQQGRGLVYVIHLDRLLAGPTIERHQKETPRYADTHESDSQSIGQGADTLADNIADTHDRQPVRTLCTSTAIPSYDDRCPQRINDKSRPAQTGKEVIETAYFHLNPDCRSVPPGEWQFHETCAEEIGRTVPQERRPELIQAVLAMLDEERRKSQTPILTLRARKYQILRLIRQFGAGDTSVYVTRSKASVTSSPGSGKADDERQRLFTEIHRIMDKGVSDPKRLVRRLSEAGILEQIVADMRGTLCPGFPAGKLLNCVCIVAKERGWTGWQDFEQNREALQREITANLCQTSRTSSPIPPPVVESPHTAHTTTETGSKNGSETSATADCEADFATLSTQELANVLAGTCKEGRELAALLIAKSTDRSEFVRALQAWGVRPTASAQKQGTASEP